MSSGQRSTVANFLKRAKEDSKMTARRLLELPALPTHYSLLFRLSIATVVLLSLTTPIFWISTGGGFRLDLGQSIGAAFPIPGGTGLKLVEDPLSPPKAKLEEKEVTPVEVVNEKPQATDDGLANSGGKGAGVQEDSKKVVKESEGDKAEEAGSDGGEGGEEGENKPVKKSEAQRQYEAVERHIERPERGWEARMGTMAGVGRTLASYAAKNGHPGLAKALKEHIERCERIRYNYKKGEEWTGESAALIALRILDIQVARAREWKSSMTTIGKLRSDLENVRDRVLNLQRERNVLDLAATKALPKGLHCLSMKLTVEHNLKELNKKSWWGQTRAPQLDDPSLYHYALFSDNVLAASVVVNSTVTNAVDPTKHVFHIVTDAMNKNAFEAWFGLHGPQGAAMEIQTVEEFKFLNASYCPVLEQLTNKDMKAFYFKAATAKDGMQNGTSSDANKAMEDINGHKQAKYRNPKYLSMLNHLRFYLPEMYPKLNKVVFLDDDIVVQKDLTPLWDINLKGNVNGAVFTCVEDSDFHRLHKYVNFSHPLIAEHFDRDSCGWAYGMNVFDLAAWRAADLTAVYHKWQRANNDRTLWRLGTLPPGLLTFYNLTYGLENHWHVLGLGYNPSISLDEVKGAAVVHYNGNQKPWMDIAMKHFQPFWSKYIATGDEMIAACNLEAVSAQ